MKTLFLASVLPLLFAFVACSDNANPAAGGDDDDDDDGTSSGEESSGGESSSSGSGATSSSSGSSGGSTSSGGSSGPFACPTGTTETTIRVATGNISNGNAQDYDDGTGLRIFKGLQPDIALVQEMNYRTNSDADLEAFVATGFGAPYKYYRAGPTDADLPNGIVSRYPFVASGEGVDDYVGGTRNFAWARLDVPGDNDVLAVSVHLATNGSKRVDEVPQLMSMISGIYHDGDLLVLGGDFNTSTRTDVGMAQIAARFVTAGPYPVDEVGNDGTNTNRNEVRDSGGEPKAKPYDWVIGDSATQARARTTQVGPLEFPDGLVFDSRVFSDLSLVPGVLATDSSLHQHMAVVRTFAVCE